jgi:hypothetical protein
VHHITWTRGPNSATDDLGNLAKPIAKELLAVAQVAVRIPGTGPDSDWDEGRSVPGPGEPQLYWRRGLTPEQRLELDRAEAAGQDLDDIDQPWNYSLLYRERTFRETIGRHRGKGFVILRVVRNENIGSELLRLAGSLRMS